MSYTMTLDMSTKASAYVKHRGPCFQSQLQSLVIAFVTTEMQREGFPWQGDLCDENDEGISPRQLNPLSNGKVVFDAIRACPVDVELGKLIPRRSSCARAHPIDFAAMFREDV